MKKKELEIWLEAYKTLCYQLERYVPGVRLKHLTAKEWIDLQARRIHLDLKEKEDG